MPFEIISKAPAASHKPGVAEDMGRQYGIGGGEGAASLIGGIGDIRALGEQAAGFVADKMGLKGGKSAKMQAPLPLQMLSGAAEKWAAAHGIDPKVARMAFSLMPGGLALAPTTSDVVDVASGGKPLPAPETKWGERARTGGQFTVAAAMPGGLARRAANVVAPAVLSQAAGEITEGKPTESYARMAGALLGAGGVGLVGRAGPRSTLLANASRGASDQQVAMARQLMEQGQARGVRLTMAEALQQVTNSGTGMGRLQRVVEGTQAGNQRIAPVMAERPGQVRRAVADFADTVAPATDQPSMIGPAAQRAADQGITGARRMVNSFAEPHYDALSGQEVPPADYAALANNPSYQQALAGLRGNPELAAQVAGLPDNNVAVVNEVLKRLNTTAEQVRPGPMNPMGDNGLAALRDHAAGSASEIAGNASPDFAAARQGVAAGRQAYVEPLQRGPLGQMANTADVGQQTGALFPAQPMEGAAAETARALQMTAASDPAAASSLVRQHLVNSANEATQDLQAGPNPWGGAKWAATQMGNPEQAATLRAGVGAVGGDVANLDQLIEIMRATGKRQAPGSLTAYNNRDLEELGKAGVVGEVARTGLNPPGFFRRIGQGFQDWQTERNAGRLADAILANPADAERILLRARQVVPEGPELQAIERAAMAAQLSRQPQEAAGAPR